MDLGRNQYDVSLELGIFQGRPKSIRPNSETVKIRPMAPEAESTHFFRPISVHPLSSRSRFKVLAWSGMSSRGGTSDAATARSEMFLATVRVLSVCKSLPPMKNTIRLNRPFAGKKGLTSPTRAPGRTRILKLGNVRFLPCESVIIRLRVGEVLKRC